MLNQSQREICVPQARRHVDSTLAAVYPPAVSANRGVPGAKASSDRALGLEEHLGQDDPASTRLERQPQSHLRVLALEEIGAVLRTVHQIAVGLLHTLRQGIADTVVVEGDGLAGSVG